MIAAGLIISIATSLVIFSIATAALESPDLSGLQDIRSPVHGIFGCWRLWKSRLQLHARGSLRTALLYGLNVLLPQPDRDRLVSFSRLVFQS
jgi:hypothetical protein